MANIPVENQHSISMSIKPSLGVRGKKNLEGGGGGGRREDREDSRCLPFTLFSSLFPPETPDTQANVQ